MSRGVFLRRVAIMTSRDIDEILAAVGW
jgi:hypothetical protein